MSDELRAISLRDGGLHPCVIEQARGGIVVARLYDRRSAVRRTVAYHEEGWIMG